MAIYNQGSAGGNYTAPGAGFIGGPPPAAPTKPKKPPAADFSNIGSIIGSSTGGFDGIKGKTPTVQYPGGSASQGDLIDAFRGIGGAIAGGAGTYVDAVGGSQDPPSATFPTPPAAGPTAAPPSQYDTDPQVMINKLLEQLGIGTIDADLKAQRERAIIGWGDPALAEMAGFGIDPQAGVFAQQNYLSGNAGLAKINKQHDLNSRGIVNKLAGRGLLRSGDLGYQTGEENQAYASNQYEGRQKILEYLTQISQQAQDRRNALRQSVIQSVMAAYQNMGQNPQAYASLYGG